MSVVPRKDLEAVQFCENHIAPFTTNATAIGTTTAAVTDLSTKTTAARTAYDAAQAAADASKAAYQTYHNAVATMRIAVAGIIKQVGVKAETSGNPDVYALAQLPAPATPTSVGAPGTPFELKVTLKPNGSLKLGWKCANPAGCTNVIYQVYRKVEGETAFTYIGGAGQREYTDTTVPSGVATITYSIQGTRSTAVGDAQEFVVNFGTTGSTTVTATITGATPKIAA